MQRSNVLLNYVQYRNGSQCNLQEFYASASLSISVKLGANGYSGDFCRKALDFPLPFT